MATYYYVGGTGNTTATNAWATSSGGTGTVTSTSFTAADELIFDSASTGTCTHPSAATLTCRSIDFNGFTGGFITVATSNINIGDGTAGTGNRALRLSSGMTANITGGTITFQSTSATQQTITSNGKSMNAVTFSGVGSSYLLFDASNIGTLTFNNGSLDTNNASHRWVTWTSIGTSVRTLTLGSSSIVNYDWVTRITAGNITITSNTATVTQSINTNANFDNNSIGGGNYQGLSVVQPNSGIGVIGINGGSAITLANYTRTGTAAKTCSLVIATGLTCTGTFTVNGNSLTDRMLVSSSVAGTSATVTTAAYSLSNSDFTDITAAGAGGTWSGTSIGDALGNSNITFTTPVTRYAVTAGNWSSTSMWSTSSGGSSGASVPLCHDAVIMDASSGAGSYTADMPRLCKDLNCTGFTRTLLGLATVTKTIYGNITLSSGMTLTATGSWVWAGRGSQTLTNAGKTWNVTSGSYGISVSAYGGSYTLQDAFTMTGSSASNQFNVIAGTFNDNNHSVSVRNFGTSGTLTRAFSIGTAGWSLTSPSASTLWNIQSTTGLTFTQVGDITVSTTATVNRNWAGGGLNYKTVNYTVSASTGGLQITVGCYIETLNFTDASNARNLLITAGQTLTVKNFNVAGASGRLVTLASGTAGSPAFLELIGPYASGADWLSVQDIYGVIPSKTYLGANSTNVSGNTNVFFAAPPASGPYIDFVAETSGSGTATSVAFPYGQTASANELVVVGFLTAGSPGTITLSGYTFIDVSTGGSSNNNTYYKVASGGESGVSITNTSSPSNTVIKVAVISFPEIPALDVKDKNSSTSSATSLSTGTGVTNTDASAVAIGFWSSVSSLGSSVSATNGYQIQKYNSEPTIGRMVAQVLTTTGSQSTTYTWTSARSGTASQLVVFKSVISVPTTGNFFLMF